MRLEPREHLLEGSGLSVSDLWVCVLAYHGEACWTEGKTNVSWLNFGGRRAEGKEIPFSIWDGALPCGTPG